MDELIGGIIAFLVFLGLSIPIIVIGVVYYLKKRLEHRQIMAAIEKGTPLSELRPPKQNGALWIRNLTVGIVLIIVGLAFIVAGPAGTPSLFVGLIVCGIGIASVVRGALLRKYEPQIQPSAENNRAENHSEDRRQKTEE